METPTPLFFSRLSDGTLLCALCPHKCRIKDGASGLCRVRANEKGNPLLHRYGYVTSLADDPIEKKPLYHFRPGSSVFSVGFVSCNLRCPFCQNWRISQDPDVDASFLSPKDLISIAVDRGATSIAYTYSEPLVHVEYLLEAMALARKAKRANVLVTNGCVLEAPARRVLSLCDAANVDLKTASAETYERTLGGNLATVRAFIALSRELGVHVEVTTLVVTRMNDTMDEIAACADFLSSLSTDIPYHLSAYHPEYRYTQPSTPAELLKKCASVARKKLSYVYVGNVPGESNDTECPVCGARVVKRWGYSIDTTGLFRDHDGKYTCKACNAALPFKD